jgi:Ca2+-binding RTX toxin-like protein
VSDAAGVDIVFTMIDYSLGAGIERLRGRSDTGLALTGNGEDNTITGSDGDDAITGGMGRDIMFGGAGGDTFIFASAAETGVAAARDIIRDFVSGVDTIDLSAIDADTGAANDQAFGFIGAGAFSRTAGELQARIVGANTVVSGDTDGNGQADFQILLSGHVTLQETDFLL